MGKYSWSCMVGNGHGQVLHVYHVHSLLQTNYPLLHKLASLIIFTTSI